MSFEGKRAVTVFGSGAVKEGSEAYLQALELGRGLAEAGFAVCNGGYGGVMEASARGAKEAGGLTVGITAEELKGWPNPWIQREVKLGTWRERLFGLIATGDAYVLFDGATGTFTELFIVWEMTNKKLLARPICVLGRFLRSWIENLRAEPSVVFNDFLHPVEHPRAVLGLLAP